MKNTTHVNLAKPVTVLLNGECWQDCCRGLMHVDLFLFFEQHPFCYNDLMKLLTFESFVAHVWALTSVFVSLK